MFPRGVAANNLVTSPRAWNPAVGTGPQGGTGPAGQLLVATVSPVAQYLNLELIVNPPRQEAFSLGNSKTSKGVTGNFIQVHAEGADVYIVVGKTVAEVSGMSGGTRGVIGASGTYVGATGTTWRIPQNTTYKFAPSPGQDVIMGVAASATGTLRLYMANDLTGAM